MAEQGKKPVTIDIDGETFELRKLGVRDLLSAKDEVIRTVRREKLKAIADLRDALPADLWQAEWDRAKAEAFAMTTVEMAVVKQWLDTFDGMAFALHMAIQSKYPGRFTVTELRDKLYGIADAAREALYAVTANESQGEVTSEPVR